MRLVHSKRLESSEACLFVAHRLRYVHITALLVICGLLIAALTFALLEGVRIGVVLPALLASIVSLMVLIWCFHNQRKANDSKWRLAVCQDGIYVVLDKPIAEYSTLHLGLDEIQGVQRCDRGGIGGGTYLDVLVEPGTLEGLPSRPLVESVAFEALALAGHRVSWGRDRLQISLPTFPFEQAPEVERALQVFARHGVSILEPRREFWPGGTLGFNANAGDDAACDARRPVSE